MAVLSKKEIAGINLNAAKIRRLALDMVYRATSGHLGGSLSIAELLSVLYMKEMNVDTEHPDDPDRDRLVLSKGHCTPALYPALALKGFFPVDELEKFRDIRYEMSGHADIHVKGVDMSTGSLGQGVSVAVGMALAGKMDQKDYRVYAILGDGEIEEGQVWEAAMAAGNYKLDNFCAIIDWNGIQIDGTLEEIMSPCPIDQKFEAFKFHTIVCDGHDVQAIYDALEEAKAHKGQPSAIIIKTTKGKGVSFMENSNLWHGCDPDTEQYQAAIAEIDPVIAQYEKEVLA